MTDKERPWGEWIQVDPYPGSEHKASLFVGYEQYMSGPRVLLKLHTLQPGGSCSASSISFEPEELGRVRAVLEAVEKRLARAGAR